MPKYSPKVVQKFKDVIPQEHATVAPEDMLRMHEYDFSTMKMVYLTCVNHPNAYWLTKNPFERNIHFLQGVNGLPSMVDEECDCPFQDLRVVKEK